MGFAVGNERLIGALARVKSYLDYGAFTPVQVAAAAALNGPQDCVDEIRDRFTRVAPGHAWSTSLVRAGWSHPGSSRDDVCLGADSGRVMRRLSVLLEFSKLLLEKAQVAVSPGIGFR